MIFPLPGAKTSISFQPGGSVPKLRSMSTHQFEFWGKPMGE